jgi:uncharacterized membrane protein YfcA
VATAGNKSFLVLFFKKEHSYLCFEKIIPRVAQAVAAVYSAAMSYVFVLIVGLAAGTLSGIIGTGSSIMLLPVLVYQFGPKQAVPIMAIASVMANIGKITSWWRDVEWRAFAAYSITGVPAAAIGARTLLILPSHIVDVALGSFFLVMIPVRRRLHASSFRISLWQLAGAGAAIGFLTGIVLSTGPLSVPAFTSYGLAKGAFLATEAASSLALMVSKVVTFRRSGALPPPAIFQGLIIGSSVMAGSFAGKLVVQRMSASTFQLLLDILLACSGVSLLWAAVE